MKYYRLALITALLAILGLTGCTADNPANVVNPPDTPLEVSVVDGNISSTGQVTVLNTPLPVDISQSDTYLASISEKQISGHSAFFKLGFNNAVGTTEEDIWYASSTYVFPAAAQRMIVYSSNVADNATGTGARSVIIYYLDNTYAEQSEIVTLNGATAVQTVATNIFRINGFRVYTTGTGYKAAGHIDLRNVGDTISYSYIAAGLTRARDSNYTVPLGKTLYIDEFFVGVGGLNATNMCRATLRGTYNEESDVMLTAGLFFMPFVELVCPNGSVVRNFALPIRFPATTDIKASAYTDSGSAYVEISYRGWIENG